MQVAQAFFPYVKKEMIKNLKIAISGPADPADHERFIDAFTHGSDDGQNETHQEANQEPWVTF